jgi:hypothetical protein
MTKFICVALLLTLALTSVASTRTLVAWKPPPEYNSMAELLSAAANEPQLSDVSTLLAALTVGVAPHSHTPAQYCLWLLLLVVAIVVPYSTRLSRSCVVPTCHVVVRLNTAACLAPQAANFTIPDVTGQ